MNIVMISRFVIRVALAAMPILGCSGSDPQTAFANSVSSRNVAAVQGSTSVRSAPGTLFRLVLAPTGNTARYRVRERLVGHDLPNDAIGETQSLTGGISFDSNGKVIRTASKFTVDAGSFVSDKDRRDGFVRGRLLDAEQYPAIVLVPTDVRGVSLPIPTSGTRSVEMTADLTVRGVTRPTIWKGTVQFKDGGVAGSAATAFTFDDIRMEQPRVPVLLAVADTIRLEINFNLVKQR